MGARLKGERERPIPAIFLMVSPFPTPSSYFRSSSGSTGEKGEKKASLSPLDSTGREKGFEGLHCYISGCYRRSVGGKKKKREGRRIVPLLLRSSGDRRYLRMESPRCPTFRERKKKGKRSLCASLKPVRKAGFLRRAALSPRVLCLDHSAPSKGKKKKRGGGQRLSSDNPLSRPSRH